LYRNTGYILVSECSRRIVGKIDARIDARIAAPIVARIAARIAARIVVMKQMYITFVKYQLCARHAPSTIRASIRATI